VYTETATASEVGKRERNLPTVSWHLSLVRFIPSKYLRQIYKEKFISK